MRVMLVIMLLLVLAAPLQAQAISREQAMKAQKLQEEALALFGEEKWEEAAAKCEAFLKIIPNDSTMQYNMACANARLNKPEDAITWLKKSLDNGYAEPDHMLQDPDLAALHKHAEWGKLVERAKQNEELGGPLDKGIEIDGVKTIEAMPEGGLRYRLRMPKEIDVKQPPRLIVWLHPSGGSMNSTVEKLSPELIKRGYALLVPTQKNWAGWSDKDVAKLTEKTLPHVAKTEGLVADKPLLMGFSAGGQVALLLWQDKPNAYGGLIISAAYPLKLEEDGIKTLELPKDKAALKSTPILAAVGDQDRGLTTWQQAQNKWLDAGVPLKVEVVAKRRHEWLFTEPTLERAYKWLEEVRAGKVPTDNVTTRPKRQVAI